MFERKWWLNWRQIVDFFDWWSPRSTLRRFQHNLLFVKNDKRGFLHIELKNNRKFINIDGFQGGHRIDMRMRAQVELVEEGEEWIHIFTSELGWIRFNFDFGEYRESAVFKSNFANSIVHLWKYTSEFVHSHWNEMRQKN